MRGPPDPSCQECRELAAKLLGWLRPGGHLFFRESCFHASGNAARRFNPTKYRTPEQLLGRRGVACGHVWGLVEGEEKHRPLFTYTNNMNTHGFQANVVITGATACATAAAFKAPHRHRLLAPPRHKRHRYSQFFSDALADGFRYQLSGTNFVESYAKLKGNMHQYWETALPWLGRPVSFALRATLPPGASVLDVGCGAGGTAYYLASHCPGIFVHGANWSSEMASFNAGRLPQVPSELRARVSFELTPECGENELRYPPNIFDLVVIRETFMYLEPEDKAVILRKVKKMLRPGGRVLIIDYCRGRPALSQTFQSHIRRWHYDCSSPAELEELLAHHFEVSLAEDHTQDFIKYMEEGLARIEENLGPSTWKEVQKEASEAAMEKLKLYKASIESDIEIQKEDYHWVKDTWSLERQAAMDGDLKWYIFVGKKGDLSS
eukprot:g19504.t1